MRLEFDDQLNNYLHVTESGARSDRPSLVFLHYFGGAASSWREVIEILARNFHCVALDLRGFGRSSRAWENYRLEDYAADISKTIEKLKLENYSLIGHSMGGKIAFISAATAAKNLRSLVLLAPSPPSPEPMTSKERKRLRETHGTRAAAIETINKSSHRKLAPKIFKIAVDNNLTSDESAWRAWLDVESRRDVTAQSAKIVVPVLCVVGVHDENITVELVTCEILGRCANASLKVIADAAHLLPLEAAAEVAGMIEDFLDKSS